MKEVVVHAYCDGFPLPHTDQTPAVIERTPGLDGEQAVVDMCEVCDKALDEVRALIERGSPPEKRTRKYPERRVSPGTKPGGSPEFNTEFMRTCQDCGYVCPTRTALGQHVSAKHNMKLGDYDWTQPAVP